MTGIALTSRERDMRRLAIAMAERDTLARVLNAVPVAAHNAAVRASGVDLLEYTRAMEHGLHVEPDVPLSPREVTP
jgi:hypothetical protein